MVRRTVGPLVALTIAACAACGTAFTEAPKDLDASDVDDGAAPVLDGSAHDGDDGRRDASDAATSRDDGGTAVDGSTGSSDGGPALPPEAGLCAGTCPSGFLCVATKCEDRAVLHFTTLASSDGNWIYGYSSTFGNTFQPYSSHWAPTSTIDVWTDTMAHTLEPSLFHNGSLMSQVYGGMTIPAATIGLVPAEAGQPSILRWKAPTSGNFAINATFTGISTPATVALAGVFVNGTTGPGNSGGINAYTAGNAFTFSADMQTLMAGQFVDFYVQPVPNRDDPAGGVTVDAKLTAE